MARGINWRTHGSFGARREARWLKAACLHPPTARKFPPGASSPPASSSAPLPPHLLPPSVQHTALPLRPRSSSGYRGVGLRPSCVYYAEINYGDTSSRLGTFDTAHEATRVYDAAAWRLGRPRSQMNFSDVRTCEQAKDLAPPPRLISDEDRHLQRRRERRLLVA
ncbi:uncharacterized protein [Aegilops tauschii subsp. strangulata]|uniref:uncharacterized protein n=1 Tax=Aegilops tauschii subsp. strangulata TaxID=200361 RepID=UPI00098A18D3|nr:ethylene-responsive transcription factor ERF110-like [Aegilops tauschii subsp. strangulata]